MAKYRKRQVEVEAFQILIGTMRRRDYPQWFADAIASGVVYQKANTGYPVECTIRTLEGEMNANICDYINRLADLIDPTCHLVGTTSEEVLYGTTIFRHELSCGHTRYTGWPEPPAFCDECGARRNNDEW